METQTKKRPLSWIWSVLPSNAGTSGFGTLLPLFVRQLGGTVVNFAVMSTLYNITVTISQYLWGGATDRLGRRRLFFTVAFAGIGLVYLSMFLVPTLEWLTIGYGILGIVIVANSTAASLLVMETSEKKYWVSSFSLLALVSNLGAVIGLVAGIFWSTFLPLHGFILFCAACEAVSVFLTYRLVSEPAVLLETAQLSFNPFTVVSKLYQGATITLQTPRRLLRAIRAPGDRERKLLFMSSFVFMIANTLQGTPFTPFLLAYRVGDNEAFAVSLVSVITQILAYKWMGQITKRRGVGSALTASIASRVILFLASAALALFTSGQGLFVGALIWNSLSGFTWAVWNSTVNVAFFSSMGPERRGGLLGAFSALNNFGAVLGAFFSGYISYYIGYATNFGISAILMLISLVVLRPALSGVRLKQELTTI